MKIQRKIDGEEFFKLIPPPPFEVVLMFSVKLESVIDPLEFSHIIAPPWNAAELEVKAQFKTERLESVKYTAPAPFVVEF